jgi:hypothetical protein
MVRAWAVDLVNGSDTQYSVAAQTGSITAATKANPCQITSTGHGLLTGDSIHITGVGGMTQLNNTTFTITYVDANNFTLDGINSTSYGTYTSGGTWATSITKANPCKVTLKAHGFTDGQLVYPTGISGMTQLNAIVHKVANATTNTFTLTDLNDNPINSTGYTTCISSGTWFTYSFNIASITKANPAVVTCTKHNFSNGDKVFISCEGMTEIDRFVVTVANKTDTTFECSGINSSAFSTFTRGHVRKPYLLANTLNAIPAQILNDHVSNTDAYVGFSKTFTPDATIQVGSGNITFTAGSTSVTTSVSLVGTVVAGNYIGLTTAVGTGCYFGGVANDPRTTKPDLYYKVASVSASTIVLLTAYAGTTTTVSTISRLRSGTEIRTTGSASATAISWDKNGTTLEGGQDLSGGLMTRNGETWFSAVTAADNYAMVIGGTSITARFFGFVGNSYRGALNNGIDCVFEYCYGNANLYYAFTNSGTRAIIRYCSGTTTSGGAYGTFYITGTDNLVEYSYAVATLTANWNTFQSGSARTIFKYCLAERAYYSFVGANNAGGYFEGCEARYSAVAALGTLNCIFKNIKAVGCSYGFLPQSQQKGMVVIGYDFQTCTYGLYLSQIGGAVMSDGICTSCGRDFYADAYVNDAVVYGHTSVTPTTFAFDVSATGGLAISNFSIDAPSIAKAFSSVATTYGDKRPVYTLQGCSQFPDGQYFALGSVAKDTTDTYSGGAWSVKIQLATSALYEGQDVPLFEVPIASGVGGTVTYRIKRHASWTGTLTPKFWLDGEEIETETAITQADISDSTYTQFTATVSGANVGHDGMLQFGFLHKGTVNPLNVDFLSGGFS